MPHSFRRFEKGEVKPKPYPQLDAAHYVKLVNKVRRAKQKSEEDIAFSEIVNGLKPRMRNLCAKFNIPGLGYDDIYQEALYALRYKAIKDYDKTRGTGEGPAPFDRFALLCIRRHLATELKTSHQMRRRVLNGAISLDQERGEANDDLSLMNIIPHTKGDVLELIAEREYFCKLIHKLLDGLSPFEENVFRLYIEKYTYEEIAAILDKLDASANIKIKSVDNGLSRLKLKAREILKLKMFRDAEINS